MSLSLRLLHSPPFQLLILDWRQKTTGPTSFLCTQTHTHAEPERNAFNWERTEVPEKECINFWRQKFFFGVLNSNEDTSRSGVPRLGCDSPSLSCPGSWPQCPFSSIRSHFFCPTGAGGIIFALTTRWTALSDRLPPRGGLALRLRPFYLLCLPDFSPALL